jgi:hypothetical protein
MTGCLEGVPGSTSGFYPDDIREPYALVSGTSTAIWELETLARDLHQAVDQNGRIGAHPCSVSPKRAFLTTTEYISAVALYDASIGALSTGSNVAHQRRRSPSTHGRSLRNSCGTPSSGEVSARSGPRFQKGVAEPLGSTRLLTSLLIMSELLLKPNVILVYSSTRGRESPQFSNYLPANSFQF